MEILLAILLYLQVIFSPGTYTTTQIDKYHAEYQPKIEEVQANEAQMRIVNEEYLPQVDHIIVIDETVNR